MACNIHINMTFCWLLPFLWWYLMVLSDSDVVNRSLNYCNRHVDFIMLFPGQKTWYFLGRTLLYREKITSTITVFEVDMLPSFFWQVASLCLAFLQLYMFTNCKTNFAFKNSFNNLQYENSEKQNTRLLFLARGHVLSNVWYLIEDSADSKYFVQ